MAAASSTSMGVPYQVDAGFDSARAAFSRASRPADGAALRCSATTVAGAAATLEDGDVDLAEAGVAADSAGKAA